MRLTGGISVDYRRGRPRERPGERAIIKRLRRGSQNAATPVGVGDAGPGAARSGLVRFQGGRARRRRLNWAIPGNGARGRRDARTASERWGAAHPWRADGAAQALDRRLAHTLGLAAVTFLLPFGFCTPPFDGGITSCNLYETDSPTRRRRPNVARLQPVLGGLDRVAEPTDASHAHSGRRRLSGRLTQCARAGLFWTAHGSAPSASH